MLIFIAFSFLYAQSPSADHKANQYLQDAHKQRELEYKRSKLLEKKYKGERVHIEPKTPSENSYGVIQEAPEEENPSFEERDVIYAADPLEQAFQDAEQERANRRYQYRQKKRFIKGYLHNAENDGTKVNIDSNYNVEEAGRRQPSQRQNSRSSGSSN